MKLTSAEARMYGSRYYVLVPHLTVATSWYSQDWLDMVEWMVEIFGPIEQPKAGSITPVPNQRWYVYDGKFLFRNEEDKILFLLKWS